VSNLAARLLVAAVFVPAILSLVFIVHPIGFFLLCFVAAAVSAFELFSMVNPKDRVAQGVGIAITLAVSLALWTHGADPRVLLTIAIGVPLVGLLVPLVRLGDIQTAGLRSAAYAFGPLYCALPLTFLALIRRDHRPGYVIFALMLSWFSDTGGYFAGRFFGKRKLYEAVSPKKTIEGAIGGLVAVVIGATVSSLFLIRGGDLPITHAIPLALVGGALGQAGDLAESLLKRSVGVKDSGAILPGHGGILDRIDAMMFTSTAVFLYLVWR
jgi:phosphatidate cytidylyltransferase